MRPIKELFFEEYWNIGYRKFNKDDTVVSAGRSCCFNLLKAGYRYWYADPFLFEKEGKIYLFVEMFDNKTEKGLIGVSEWNGEFFSEPRVVLEEPFHLSYPYVFEKDGEIYMMPETQQDGCIQLYKCIHFPDAWKKDRVLVKISNAVDTVIINDYLLTSVVDSAVDKTTHLEMYSFDNGEPYKYNPLNTPDSKTRGAGRPFVFKDKLVRPAQDCSGGNYGKGLYFYEISFENNVYSEKMISHIDISNIRTDKISPTGLHTYAQCGDIEIVDIKSKRFNLRRLLWIISKKI